jgi:isopentenyldiphosphate isomerase
MNSNPAENDEEILDLVDEANHVIGKVRRGRVHGDPSLRHRAVHVFVKDESGRLFLQRRSKNKRVQPGKWDTSVGGHLTAGQTYEEGALKELGEELGVALPDPKTLKVSHEYVWQTDFETEHIKTFILEYNGPFKLQEAEVEDGKFWTSKELKEGVGKGIFTPNLEKELEFLGIWRRS